MTNNRRTKTKNSDNNINKLYMPRITKARQLKILKFLNLKKSPYTSINGNVKKKTQKKEKKKQKRGKKQDGINTKQKYILKSCENIKIQMEIHNLKYLK